MGYFLFGGKMLKRFTDSEVKLLKENANIKRVTNERLELTKGAVEYIPLSENLNRGIFVEPSIAVDYQTGGGESTNSAMFATFDNVSGVKHIIGARTTNISANGII